MTVSTNLLEILVCPLCKQQVVQAKMGFYLECSDCQLRFPVQNDIPVMLVDEAEKFVADQQLGTSPFIADPFL